MYKVIIVDNEYIIRQGLETSVQWSKYGCEVVGTAESGEEGLELIKRHKPDIVFTDIEMDSMSGLEMIDVAKEFNHRSKIIIITGFRNFDYAKKAIDLGVFAFLLKPTKLSEIHSTLDNAVKELKEASGGLARSEHSAIMQKIFYEYINGIKDITDDEINKIVRFCGRIEYFTIILIEKDTTDYVVGGDWINCTSVVVKEHYGNQVIIGIPIKSNRIAFIIRQCANILESCYEIQSSIRAKYDFTVSIGISSCSSDISELPLKYEECVIALEQKGYFNSQAIISAQDVEMFFKYNDYIFLDDLREQLINCVLNENSEEAQKLVKRIYEFLTSDKPLDSNIYDYYWGVAAKLKRLTGADDQTLEELALKINNGGSLEELNDFLAEFAQSCIISISKASIDKIDPKVLAMKQYIEEHYMETIRLSDLGKHIYVSPYYASRIFKKAMGISISEYINIVRIEKAKELMADVRYKIYEIAELVGIEDQRYFSKLVKNMTGYSPKEYRKRKFKELNEDNDN